MLDSSKLKEVADNNFKLKTNGRKLSKQVENTEEIGEIALIMFKILSFSKERETNSTISIIICMFCQYTSHNFCPELKSKNPKSTRLSTIIIFSEPPPAQSIDAPMKCDSSTKLATAKNTTSSLQCPLKTTKDPGQDQDGAEVGQGISKENTELDISNPSWTQTKLLEANLSPSTKADILESVNSNKTQSTHKSHTSDKYPVNDKSESYENDEKESDMASCSDNTSVDECNAKENGAQKDNSESQRNLVSGKENVSDEHAKETMETCQAEKLTDNSDIDPNDAHDTDTEKEPTSVIVETQVYESHERSEENMIVDVPQELSGSSQSVINEVKAGENNSAVGKGIESHDVIDSNMCFEEVSSVSEDIWFECKEIILEMVQYVSDEVENLSNIERSKDGANLDVENDSSGDEDGLFLHREDIGKSSHEDDIDQSSIASSDTNLTDSLNYRRISADSLHEAKETDSENPLSIEKAGKILTLWNQITEGSNTTNEELIELIAQKLEEEKSKLTHSQNNEQQDLSQGDDSCVQYGNDHMVSEGNKISIDLHSKQETEKFRDQDLANKSCQESSPAKTDVMDFNSSLKLQKPLDSEPSDRFFEAQNKSDLDLPVENSAQAADPKSTPSSSSMERKNDGSARDTGNTDLSQDSLNKEDTGMVSSNKQVIVEHEKVKPDSKNGCAVSGATSEQLLPASKQICVDEANNTNVNKGNMTQKEPQKEGKKPVIIDLESHSDTNNQPKDNTLVRRGEVTPVKQIRQGITPTPSKTPLRQPILIPSPAQLPSRSRASPSARQTPLKGNNTPGKSPASTPSKKNFIENLIATGIPIIIPDDDDTMPQERSQEFKMKSKQYQQESLKSRSQFRGSNERSPDRLIENTNINVASMFTPPRSKPVERLNVNFPVPPSSDFRIASSKPISLTPPGSSACGPFQLHARPVTPARQSLAYPETRRQGYPMSHGFSPGRPNTGIPMQGQGQRQSRPIASQSQFMRQSPQMRPQLRQYTPPKSTPNPPAARGIISGTLVIIDDDTPTTKVTKSYSLDPSIKKSPMQQFQHTQLKSSTDIREPFKQVRATQQRKLSNEVRESTQVQATQQRKLSTEVPGPLKQVQAAQQSQLTRETQPPYMQAHIAQQRKVMTEVLEAGKAQTTPQKKMSAEVQDSPMPIITNVQSMAPVHHESIEADKHKKHSTLPKTHSETSANSSESHSKITVKQEPPDQYEQPVSAPTNQKTSDVTAKRDRPTETDKDNIQTSSEPLSKRIKVEPGLENNTVSNTKDSSQLSEPFIKDNPVSSMLNLPQGPESSSSNTTEKAPVPLEKAQVSKKEKLSEKPELSKDVPVQQTQKSAGEKAEEQAPTKDRGNEETLSSPLKSRPEVILDVDVDDADSYKSSLSLEQVLQQMPSVSNSARSTAGDQKTDSDISSLRTHSRKSISKNEKDGETELEISSSEDAEKGKGESSTKGDKAQKQFGCGDCGKTYTSKQSLAQHFKVHTREQPFECDVCGKHFSLKTSLKKHIYTHFKEKQ